MARDRKTDQIVGLKILDSEKTAALEARFVGINKPKEGEIAIALEHPHIVKTLEHGITTDGEQYLVMEFLDGPGLNSLIVGRSEKLRRPPHDAPCGRRPKPWPPCTGPATSIATSARATSSSTRTCTSLKLIDFGLTVPATPPFMQPGNRTGTANYMAPEVVRRRPTSQKLDIFSFGVTAFELCAFELPWPRGSRAGRHDARLAWSRPTFASFAPRSIHAWKRRSTPASNRSRTSGPLRWRSS